MFVYFIVNHVNGRYYVGKTKTANLQRYWDKQRWNVNHPDKPGPKKPYLYNAVRKYGWKNFSIHPLITDCQTDEELLHWEQVIIKALGAQRYGYNICAGGRGALGWKPSEETKAKISASNQGKHRERLMSPESQEKRVKAWENSLEQHGGTFHAPETTEKLKAIRANQDEAYRLEQFYKFETKHGTERRKRAAATHTGMKHKMTLEGHTAISEAFKKSAAKRWAPHSLVGQTFNRLTVETKVGRNKHGLIQWNCRCVCGGTKIATTTALRIGNVKSCGCLSRELALANLRVLNSKVGTTNGPSIPILQPH